MIVKLSVLEMSSVLFKKIKIFSYVNMDTTDKFYDNKLEI